MLATLCILLSLSPAPTPAAPPLAPVDPPATIADERAPHFAPVPHALNKKGWWLRDKALRPDTHAQPSLPRAQTKTPPPKGPLDAAARLVDGPVPPVGQAVSPPTLLFNQWTREWYPVLPGQNHQRRFRLFLRDHFTGQPTAMDDQLFYVMVAASLRLRSGRVEVVSGYRAPKYNLMLRKKGHQVARESQHTQGTAVDFRLRGVPTEKLRDFVRSLRLGGVGFYPRTKFVHADTGKIRTWQGS